jgi:cytidine deaminase
LQAVFVVLYSEQHSLQASGFPGKQRAAVLRTAGRKTFRTYFQKGGICLNYDAIFQKAHEVCDTRARSGQMTGPDESVCILFSRGGRLYYGVSRKEYINGIPKDIHAEHEAMMYMKQGHEYGIQALLLMTTGTRMLMAPCSQCIREIIAMSQENLRCEILLPDRAVLITQLPNFDRRFTVSQQSVQFGGGQQSVQFNAASENSGSEALLSRVNDLLSVADDNDEDEEEEKKKRGFGGFFRRK